MDDFFFESIRKIHSFLALDAIWDRYVKDPPHLNAVTIADIILTLLHEYAICPTNITPCREGGIAFDFFPQGRDWAVIECYNTREITMVRSDSKSHKIIVDTLYYDKMDHMREAIYELKEFLHEPHEPLSPPAPMGSLR